MAQAYYPKVILPVCRNLQDIHYDCGPASLKIILETLGIHVTEKRLMKMAGTTPQAGTPPEELLKVLREEEVTYELVEPASRVVLEEKIRQLNLCLINYQAFGQGGADYESLYTGHYSVVFGFDQTHFWMADPAVHHIAGRKKWGARKIRKDLFVKHWYDKAASGTKTSHWLVAVPLCQSKR